MFKDDNDCRYIFKICLIGAGGVGKTCIAQRLCFNTFNLNTQLTVGIDFYTYNVPIIIDGEKTHIRLSIWDFGGQSHFKTLFRYYINGANGIFFVFDLLQMQSLLDLDWWYDKLIEYGVTDPPKILVGTKLDLFEQEDNQFGIDKSIIEEFIRKHGTNDFIKTSSKDNVNIQNIFKEMVKKLLDFYKLGNVKVL
ncbi:MAG: GTP-binding protein [Candidatus Lokiarchaeota archaeon]|nr:GTP-binding protein [Candidatus Lokiarchaeota archaeon]